MRITAYIVFGLLGFLASCSMLKDSVGGGKDDYRKNEQFQQRFFEAQKEKALDNPEKAYALFAECLELDPDVGAVYYEMARIDLSEHRTLMAVEALEKALDLEPENRWYYLEMGAAKNANGDYAQAADQYKKAIELFPKDHSAYFKRADALLMSNNIDQAIATYDLLEERTAVTEELSLKKYDLYLGKGKISQAESELLKLIEAYPSEVRYPGILAEFYSAKGDLDKAMELYAKMEIMDPENGLLHWQLAHHYLAMGEEENANTSFLKAMSSEDVPVFQKEEFLMSQLEMIHNNTGNIAQSLGLCEAISESGQESDNVKNIYTELLMMDGQMAKANEVIAKDIQASSSQDLWRKLLLTDVLVEDFEALISHSEDALDLYPMQAELYLFLGLGKLMRGQTNQAIIKLKTGKSFVVEDEVLKVEFDNLLAVGYQIELNDTKAKESSEKSFNGAQAITYSDNQNGLEDKYGKTLLSMKRPFASWVWFSFLTSYYEPSAVRSEGLGDTYAGFNMKEKAVFYWKEAQGLGGDQARLQKKIEEVE